jgi:hypothetical protein
VIRENTYQKVTSAKKDFLEQRDRVSCFMDRAGLFSRDAFVTHNSAMSS